MDPTRKVRPRKDGPYLFIKECDHKSTVYANGIHNKISIDVVSLAKTCEEPSPPKTLVFPPNSDVKDYWV